MGEHTWRQVSPGAARWFGFLASTGYTLADIEQKVVDDAQGGPDDRDEGDDVFDGGGKCLDEIGDPDGDTDPDAA
jgi:hypothetical protein